MTDLIERPLSSRCDSMLQGCTIYIVAAYAVLVARLFYWKEGCIKDICNEYAVEFGPF